MEKPLPAGDFKKYCNNTGHWFIVNWDPALARFVRWTYSITRKGGITISIIIVGYTIGAGAFRDNISSAKGLNLSESYHYRDGASVGGYLMVVDLQGVRTSEGYVLTDPVILCEDHHRFDNTNLGPRCMKKFVKVTDAHLAKRG